MEDKSPTITILCNKWLVRALVDTGSGHTLIQESAVAKIGGKINHSRIVPNLRGVTGKPLRVLGMLEVNIMVGREEEVRRWVSVVPDSYLSSEMLLGCDVLGQAPMTWNHKRKLIVWGGQEYPIYFIRPKGRVDRVTVVPLPKVLTNQLRVKQKYDMQPYQTLFIPVETREKPGTTLIVYPEKTMKSLTYPFVATVNEDGQVFFPTENYGRAPQKIGPGTLLGTYTEGIVEESKVCPSFTIDNELMPDLDRVEEGEDRHEKLKGLLSSLDWNHLNGENKQQLRDLVLRYPELFILGPAEIGTFQLPPAKINVADPNPVRAPRYRYPPAAQDIIQKLLTEMEEKGIIEPSTSAWLSPIVLVKKPDGSMRMCLDYRSVNTHLAADVYPLPRLEELVEVAAGHQFYATLDMKDAYYQVLLHEDSRDITTFSDGVSLHRFRRLPFGLSCSPAIFSRQLAQILAPLIKQGWVKNYLDDIILWAPSFKELIQRLETLFQALGEGGVKLNVEKCHVGKTEVKFLGHIVSSEGCKPDPANVEAVMKMQRPKRVKEVKRFLGMCGFYRKHIPNFAKIATPLTDLTRAGVEYKWTEECQEAFESLKRALLHAPILVRADGEKDFIVTTDASDTHVGGVLSQVQEDGTIAAIGYFSRKLKGAETRYSVTDKEALGVVLTCRHFQHYLWGRKFTVVTDHQPLVSIFKKKTKSPRMNRWILEIREYHFDIKYIKGKYNYVADHLSRPVMMVDANEEGHLGKSREEIRALQMGEEKWKQLIEYLEGGKISTQKGYPRGTLSQFTMYRRLLYFCSTQKDGTVMFRLVVPKCLRVLALKTAHEEVGHQGQKKTLSKAEEMFYWCNQITEVIDYVKRCPLCQQVKGSLGLQQKWKELPPVDRPLARLGVDITDLYSSSQGQRYVLTVIDSYSRYTRFYPLTTKRSEVVVQALATYIADFGLPSAIVCDNGMEFRAETFRKFCQDHHITIHYTTPYNPRGNSPTERVHRTLKQVLTTLCRGHPLRWPTVLAQCQRLLNQSVHTSTGQQPYFAFFSRHAPRNAAGFLPVVEGDEEGKAEAHRLLLEMQRTMCERGRAIANRDRKDESVEMGALVWVKSEVPVGGTCRKLNLKWVGPYRVIQVLRGGGAYILQHPFNGQTVQRAAEKVKPFRERGEWVFGPQETYEPLPEEEVIPARERRAPRRLIEEC